MRQKPPVEVFDAPSDVSGIYPASRARRQRDLGAALIQFPRCRFHGPDPRWRLDGGRSRMVALAVLALRWELIGPPPPDLSIPPLVIRRFSLQPHVEFEESFVVTEIAGSVLDGKPGASVLGSGDEGAGPELVAGGSVAALRTEGLPVPTSDSARILNRDGPVGRVRNRGTPFQVGRQHNVANSRACCLDQGMVGACTTYDRAGTDQAAEVPQGGKTLWVPESADQTLDSPFEHLARYSEDSTAATCDKRGGSCSATANTIAAPDGNSTANTITA